MPETLEQQAPLASPASIPGTELTVTQSTVPSGAPVADPGRQAIIEKYQNLYGQPEPVTPPASQPQVQAPAAPVQATPDLGGVVQALVAEMNSLKDQLKGRQTPQAVAPPVTAAEEQDWLKYLAEGKKSEGEALLANKIKSIVGDSLQQDAVEKTLALIEAKSFAEQVRKDNADLLPMEQYITAAAQQRIIAAQQAGKIKTPGDYVTVYKDAVNAELSSARNLILSFRGEGRQEGITRQTQVLASPTIQPSQVDTSRESAPQSTEQPVQTTSDYLAMRQGNKARGQGMLVG